MDAVQFGLFDAGTNLPEGMVYASGFLSRAEEAALLSKIAKLEFHAFRFRGFVGRRRVVSFGWTYDFSDLRLKRAEPIPPFLTELRTRAAELAGVASDALPHVLVTEYEPGAAIGWHRDRPEFDDVVGVSLGSRCPFRLRRWMGGHWQRQTLTLEPRSAYLLHGPSRLEWEHSIPPVETLRYSITFRSLARERS